jgi:tetratricopeptide (TPR) repeat protein
MRRSLRLLSIIAFLLFDSFLVSCSRSPASYVAQGNKNSELGHYDDAVLNYRKAIQASPRSGEAYYRWGLLEKKSNHLSESYKLITQAVALMPNRQDAVGDLCDLAATIYFGSPKRPPQLYRLLSDLSARLLLSNPRSFDGIRVKGYLAAADGRRSDAIQLFRQANEIRPGQTKVLVPLIRALFDDGRKEEGERLALDSLKVPAAEYPAYDILYNYYDGAGRKDDALKLLQDAVARHPGVPAYVLNLAAHYLKNGDAVNMDAALNGLLRTSRNTGQTELLIGDFYFNHRRLAEAVQHYQASADKSKGQARVNARERVYAALITQGNMPEARRYLADILREFPGDAGVQGTWAVFLVDHGAAQETKPAADTLEAVLKKDGRSAYFHFYLARAWQRLGQADKAQAEYTRAIALDPTDLPSRFALVELSRQASKFDRMLQYADQILAFAPGDARARLSRCVALMATGKQDQAAPELEALARQFPRAREVQFELAVLRFQQKRTRDAEPILEALYAPGNSDLEVARMLSAVDESRKDFNAAKKLWNRELSAHPDNEEARSNLARVDFNSGAYRDAAAEYERLRAANPKSPEYPRRLGEALAMQNDDQHALAALKEGEGMAPTDAETAIMLGAEYQRAGAAQDAIKFYRLALKLQPDNFRVMNNLAFLLADTGENPDEALAIATRALQKHPDEPVIKDTIGFSYLKKGMNDPALQIFEGLVRQNPQQPLYRYHLALALAKKGDRQRAKTELQAALKEETSPAKREPFLRLQATL